MFEDLQETSAPPHTQPQASLQSHEQPVVCPPDKHWQWIPLLAALLLPLGALIGIFVFINSFIRPFSFTALMGQRQMETSKNVGEVSKDIGKMSLEKTDSQTQESQPSIAPNAQKNSSSISASGSKEDGDLDGLTDAQEEIYLTSRNRFDTDEDGLDDGQEIQLYKTDPLNPDTDRDGYQDGLEVETHHDPLVR